MDSTYKNWILAQKIPDATLTDAGDAVEIATPYATARVNFYQLDVIIVELTVTNAADGENKFYLHFELKDLPYAKELFAEMVDTLTGLKNQQSVRILLSCTGGLTTGFFADKLNDAAKILNLNYEFAAVPFHKLYDAGFNYHVILLAPQIAYQLKAATEILNDKLVLKIPPKIFASYDASALIEFVRAELDKTTTATAEQTIATTHNKIKNAAKILSIAVMPFETQTRIAYRIYEQGAPIFEETVIKGKLNVVHDLQDILDTVSRRCKKFDAVGIAISGVVRGGYLDLDEYIDPDINLNQLLRETYGVPVTITNNVNAAVLGYYAQQDAYQNILFISHPRGNTIGGAGIVVNGRLILGKHNTAGEIKFATYSFIPRNEWREHHCADVDRVLELVSLEIRTGISVIDPELVCLRCEMTPDIGRVKAKVAELVPVEYLPEFVFLRDEEMAECVLLGQMLLSLEALEKSSKA